MLLSVISRCACQLSEHAVHAVVYIPDSLMMLSMLRFELFKRYHAGGCSKANSMVLNTALVLVNRIPGASFRHPVFWQATITCAASQDV